MEPAQIEEIRLMRAQAQHMVHIADKLLKNEAKPKKKYGLTDEQRARFTAKRIKSFK